MPYFDADSIPAFAQSALCPVPLRALISGPSSTVYQEPKVFAVEIYLRGGTPTSPGPVQKIDAILIEDWLPTVMSSDVARLFSIPGDSEATLFCYDDVDEMIHPLRTDVRICDRWGSAVFCLSWEDLNDAFKLEVRSTSRSLRLESREKWRCISLASS